MWLEHNCAPVYLSNGTYGGHRASNRNITDRKRAEQQARCQEARLRAILEASNESVFLMDLDGNLLASNATLASRMGTDQETLRRTNLYDFLPQDVAESRREKIRQVAATRSPARFEDERQGRTILNSICPVLSETGEVTQVAVYGVDITEERQTRRLVEEHQRRLAETAAMLQLVVDTIPVRIFWKDLDSTYLGCNRSFANDAGRTEPAEITGRNDFELS